HASGGKQVGQVRVEGGATGDDILHTATEGFAPFLVDQPVGQHKPGAVKASRFFAQLVLVGEVQRPLEESLFKPCKRRSLFKNPIVRVLDDARDRGEEGGADALEVTAEVVRACEVDAGTVRQVTVVQRAGEHVRQGQEG